VSDRVLVLGATGMLGHVVARRFAGRFDVHAGVRDPDRARRLGVAGEAHAVDAFDAVGVAALIARLQPAVVINAVGLVKQLDEAGQPIPAITVNALFPHQLAAACAEHGARLLHVSTDCVFSGALPAPAAYREDDAPDATDLYGRSKLLGEVREAPALTLRTSIIGWELERASGLLEWFAAQDGGAVKGFAGAIFSGLTTEALARVMETVVLDHPGLTGLYHVSADPIDKFALLCRLRDALGLSVEITRVEEPRINRALDSSRFAAATGIAIPSWSDMIGEYAKETHDRHA
jgi:dTDP-4-dehydrorhamnose reductase